MLGGLFIDLSLEVVSHRHFFIFGGLVAVAVTDRLPTGLSAVYTFFDPRWSAMSPGTYAILWQIREARRLGLRWLYLGFWIADSPKMAYKARFRPLQAYKDGAWKEYDIEDSLTEDDAG